MAKGDWSPFSWPASGYVCEKPFIYEYQSEERFRNCGKCKRCIAVKKRDVAGRCAAEASTSSEVVAWTLTYRNGEPGAQEFVTRDRQLFLKRMREQFRRQTQRELGAPNRFYGASAHVKEYWRVRVLQEMPKIMLMGCGERGKNGTKRCHWHMVLFFSKPSGFRTTPRDPDGRPGRENVPLWPHGFVTIHVLPEWMEARIKAVRYVAKYLDKAREPSRYGKLRGEKAEYKFFRSLSKPLGFDYLTAYARDHAAKGIPLRGDYFVPGVRFSAERGKGEGLTMHLVSGVMREHMIAAYRDEWAKRGWQAEVPMTPFMLLHDNEAIARVSPATRLKGRPWRLHGEGIEPLPQPAKRDRSGLMAIEVRDKGCVGFVQLLKSGFAQFRAADGVVHPIPNGNIRDLVHMDHDAHCKVEEWIAEKRGSDWVSGRELRIMRLRRHMAQRDAIAKFAKSAPAATPDYVPREGPMTALKRKLLINGNGHIPGTVVVDPWDKHKVPFVRGVTKPKKDADKRYV